MNAAPRSAAAEALAMETVGTVKEIWRFPIKSMAGQRLEYCAVTALGIIGDRGWATRDEKAGEIRGAKKLPALMRCAARYLREPSTAEIPQCEITFPDGSRAQTGGDEANAKLSALLGRPVTLWPRRPPSELDFYRRAAPDNPDMMAELREVFGRLPDEPLPDLTTMPPEVLQYTSPLGTFFDAFPMHFVTTASLAHLARINPAATFDLRRFRPNLLIETLSGFDGLVESKWNGRALRIGAAKLKVETGCVRCVMTTLEQRGLAKDPSVLRTIVREAAQNLGSYASVAAAGRIAEGDEVVLE
jgi:MOSC domain-containing protein